MAYTDQIPDLNMTDLSLDSVKAYLTSNQSVPKNTWTALSFGGTVWDTKNFWSAGSPTRLTIPTDEDGRYWIRGNCVWELVTQDSSTQGRIYRNGIAIPASHSGQYVNRAAGGSTWLPTNNLIDYQMDLSAVDYIEFFVWCSLSSGSGVDAEGNSNSLYASWLELERIS